MTGRSAVAVLVALVALSQSAPAAGDATKAILVLHTYGHDAPFRYPFDAAFARSLRQADGFRVDLYIESLDPNRFGGEAQAERERAYLRDKYADKKLSVIVAVYDRALSFLRDDGDPLFKGVPIVAALSSYPSAHLQDMSVLWGGDTLAETVTLARKLSPGATRIVHVDGVPPGDGDTVYQESQRQLAAVTGGIPLTSLHNLSLDELLSRTDGFTPDTIVLMGRQTIGHAGQPISSAEAVQEVAARSSAPVYVTNEMQIGTGAVGGIVVNIERMAADLSALVLQTARSGRADLSITQQRLAPTFDWRQLQRFGIDERLLPPASRVLFRQPTTWSEYRSYVIATVLILAVQSVLIAGLLAQRVRRRRADHALRASQQRLQSVYDLNQDLAGRLITAQEDERSRIARDLHDDVGQQLVGLAFIVSAIKRKIGGVSDAPEVDEAFASLHERTSTLAQLVRKLSHELHPAVLEHAGLTAALKDHCAEVARRHDVAVTFSGPENIEGLHPDIALCIFRVAQEAIANAIRHAGANAIDVRLERTSADIALTVVDDGIGFIASERTGTGLGLRSIEERVRLTRGELTLHSHPGDGTRLRVRIPTP